MQRKHRRPAVLVAVIATAALALGACSGDDDDDDAAATDTTAATEATMADAPDTTTAAEETEEGQTIVDIAAGNDDFSTLVSAVQAAGLAETLSGEGPFTVFAPTNEAFAKLPAGTVDNLLLPENKDQLTAVLTYHVVPAAVMAADVTAGEVTTVNGAPFTVATDGGVTITDGQGNVANVVQTDIEGSNGVIHVIDTVLLPPAS
jgi:uncharacterized surface protein with fasciclin (FAS1) repeats